MNILIVQTAFLGDVVLTTPVISSVKKLYPEAKIYTLTTPQGAEFFKSDKNIYKTLTYNKNKERGLSAFLNQVKILKNEKIDIAFAIQKSFRTSLLLFLARIKRRVGFLDAGFSFLYTDTVKQEKSSHAVLRNLSILSLEKNYKDIDDNLRLCLPSDDVLGKDYLSKISNLNDFVIIAPGSAWKTKRWKKEEFKELAEEILNIGKEVVIIGGPAEKNIADYIANGLNVTNFAGEFSISQTVYLVSRASAVVCNDSMMLHVASSFKIPTVVIFCATSPEFGFGPWKNEKSAIVQDETLSCKPCMHHGGNVCPNKTEQCRKVSHKIVLQKLLDFFK